MQEVHHDQASANAPPVRSQAYLTVKLVKSKGLLFYLLRLLSLIGDFIGGFLLHPSALLLQSFEHFSPVCDTFSLLLHMLIDVFCCLLHLSKLLPNRFYLFQLPSLFGQLIIEFLDNQSTVKEALKKHLRFSVHYSFASVD